MTLDASSGVALARSLDAASAAAADPAAATLFRGLATRAMSEAGAYIRHFSAQPEPILTQNIPSAIPGTP